MKGYFISQEDAKRLGLLDNSKIVSNLQKTIIAITENDLQNEYPNLNVQEQKVTEFAKWFYENYYQTLLESFVMEENV